MELNTVNFFTHLIFHPSDAETKKQQKIALISSIAIGILSLFTVHLVCAVIRFFIKKSENHSTTEEKTGEVAEEKVVPKQREEINPGQLMGEKSLSHLTVKVYQGDLLNQQVDAIVNPANTSLQGGGGVDGLIKRAAGSSIYKECKHQLEVKGLSACNTGDAYITGSGKLQEKGINHVIHAVGPRGSTADGDRLLKAAYTNSLLRAHEKGLKSIAFPAISIGIFGYDPSRAAVLAYEAIEEFDREHPDTTLKNVRLVFWTGENDQLSLLKMLSLIS